MCEFDVCVFISDWSASPEFTSEPEALPERPDRKTSDGEAEVGHGI